LMQALHAQADGFAYAELKTMKSHQSSSKIQHYNASKRR
jgi:hypothetical protein